MKKEEESVFGVLNAINCNGHTEEKNGLTYLSWAWAWQMVMKIYPEASYTIYKDEQNRPYIEDPDFGLMCYTTVTINGQTREMWLPVMNGANKAMRRQPYTYKVWNNYKKQWEEKSVEAATMFDINKTIMRCLVKNLAMFGLGIYIYAGEDLPSGEAEKMSADDEADFELACQRIKEAKNRDELVVIYNDCPKFHSRPEFVDRLNARQEEFSNQ